MQKGACWLIFFIFNCFFVFSAHAAETYTLDNYHSYVLWRVNHLGFSTIAGKWMADGTLTLDEQHPQNSKVNVTIHVDNMITGIPKFDEHLKSADFFDVAKFPEASFVSDHVQMIGKDRAKIQGQLTVHGVTKPVTLEVKLNKFGISAMNNKKTAGFSATTQLKRSDFGLGKYAPGVSDHVDLNIEVESTLAQ